MRALVVGFGNVGAGLVRALSVNAPRLRERGLDLRVVGVVDTGGAAISSGGLSLSTAAKVKELRGSVAEQPGVGRPGVGAVEALELLNPDVLVELTPTTVKTPEPGLTHILAAFKAGVDVVSANKAPFALAYDAVMEAARRSGRLVRLSATVGGGMPVLKTLTILRASDRVRGARGILNATSNYVLSLMEAEGMEMGEAVKEARRLGIAEADPSQDLDGVDTAVKLTVLGNVAFGGGLHLRDAKVRGISGIRRRDVEEVSRRGMKIKLVGRVEEGGRMAVAPEEVSRDSRICVDGVLNAVEIDAELAGSITLTGRGAGPVETASAVLRDVLEIWEVRSAGVGA